MPRFVRHIPKIHLPLKVMISLLVACVLFVVGVVVMKTQQSEEVRTTVKSDFADWDSDGLSNKQEQELGTNPNSTDTDGDGFSDWEEVKKGYSPLEIPVNQTIRSEIPEAPEQGVVLDVEWEKTLNKTAYDSFENGTVVSLKGGEGDEQMYDVGRVTSGVYEDYRIFLQLIGIMGGWDQSRYLVEGNSTRDRRIAYKVIPKEASPTQAWEVQASFKDFEQPATIPIPENSIVLERDEWGLSNLVGTYKKTFAFSYNRPVVK